MQTATIAYYVGSGDERVYVRRRLRDARASVKNLPQLRSIANGFNSFSKTLVRNNRNSLFLIASWPTSSNQTLSELETALSVFGCRKWSKKLRSDFVGRLLSPREEHSWSVFCEMNVALRLAQRYKRRNVKVFPFFPSRGPDITAKIHKRDVNFEVTAVFSGKTEERLKAICRGIAKGLYPIVRRKRYLRIQIDPAKLLKDKKDRPRIRPNIRKVLNSFNQLGLTSVIPVFNHFNLKEATDYLTTSKAYQGVPQLKEKYIRGLRKGFRSGGFKKFIQSVSQQDLSQSPISYFFTGKMGYRFVEVGFELTFPTKPAQDERDAFFRRLEKRIGAKVGSRQVIPKQIVQRKPNVLVVNGSNWTIHGYDFSGMDADLEFEPVRRTLRQSIAQCRSPYLSAIMMYENDFGNARIIENRFAEDESRLTSYEGMSLFTKKRISQLRQLKQATRIRKKIIPSKLAATGQSILTGYKTYSEIQDLAYTRSFNAQTDSALSFVQIPEVIDIPKDWLRDPNFSPDLGESGRFLGIREVAYLVKRLLEDSEETMLQTITYGDLSDVVEKFASKNGPPTVLFAPISLHLPIHNLASEASKRVLKWEKGKTILLSKNGLEIPLVWLTTMHPNTHMIIYRKKVHGEWIVKPGNATKELSLQTSTKRNQTARLVVKTVVAYNALNKNAAWRIPVTTIKE